MKALVSICIWGWWCGVQPQLHTSPAATVGCDVLVTSAKLEKKGCGKHTQVVYTLQTEFTWVGEPYCNNADIIGMRATLKTGLCKNTGLQISKQWRTDTAVYVLNMHNFTAPTHVDEQQFLSQLRDALAHCQGGFLVLKNPPQRMLQVEEKEATYAWLNGPL